MGLGRLGGGEEVRNRLDPTNLQFADWKRWGGALIRVE
jgi:hypothetical protein